MKFSAAILIFLLSFKAVCEVMPDFRPQGVYHYNGEVKVTNKRSAVSISHMSTEGQAKIKSYKAQKFICIRKSQKETICQKNETINSVPEFAQTAVDNLLTGKHFIFPGTGYIELIHDGADTEWLVTEQIKIAGAKAEQYKIVRQNNGVWNLSFPVSGEQGIANMFLYSNQLLGLPLILQKKEAEFTVGYFLLAGLLQQ